MNSDFHSDVPLESVSLGNIYFIITYSIVKDDLVVPKGLHIQVETLHVKLLFFPNFL